MDTKYLYVMGSGSGAGKSTICLGILAQLLASGFPARQLAYIKPVTQCTAPQPVALFCKNAGILYRDIGSLVFRNGFSREFIDGQTPSSKELMAEVLATIVHCGAGKSLVLIDGVGDPAVGSVVGVSNVDVAAASSCRVLFVGKPGIGAAIDNTVLCLAFIRGKDLRDVGLIYNKVPVEQRSEIRNYVTRRIATLLPEATVFGFLAEEKRLDEFARTHARERIAQWFSHGVGANALLHDWLGVTPRP